MTDDALQRGVRRGHRLPALRRAPAGRRARRRPADHRASRPARHRVEFRGGLRVTTPETMDVVRMVLVGQVQRELVGLINAHGPFAVGLSGEDAQPVHRRAARTSPSTARRSTSAWSATSSTVEPGVVRGLLDDGRIPVVSTVAPRTTDGAGLQRQRRHRRRRARRRAAGARSSSCSPTSRASTPTGRDQRPTVISSITADELEELLPDADDRDGARRWRPACAPSRAACPGARHRRPGAARAAARGVHRRGHRHDGGAATVSDRDRVDARTHRAGTRRAGTAVVMGNVRHRRRVALVRGEGAQVWDADGTRVPRPARRHRGQRRSATPTRRSSRRSPRRSRTLGHVSNLFAHEPAVALAERLLELAGAPRAGCSSATPAPRPTRPRSSWPAAPAAPRRRRRRGRRSTAGRWARSR